MKKNKKNISRIDRLLEIPQEIYSNVPKIAFNVITTRITIVFSIPPVNSDNIEAIMTNTISSTSRLYFLSRSPIFIGSFLMIRSSL